MQHPLTQLPALLETDKILGFRNLPIRCSLLKEEHLKQQQRWQKGGKQGRRQEARRESLQVDTH